MKESKKVSKLQPSEVVRPHCAHVCLCQGQFNEKLTRDCQGASTKCPLYPYRLGKRPPIKVLRDKCMWCMSDNCDSIANCTTKTCFMHLYRFGTNPARVGVGESGNMYKIAA